MKLSVNLFTTLDNVCQGPGGAEEDTRGGFTHGGWLIPHFDEGVGAAVDSWFSHTGALLLGRRTYDIFASHWPNITDPDDSTARIINGGHKYVVTSSPVDGPWNDSTTALMTTGGIERALDEVRALKEQEGDELQVHGSVQLARTLHEAGLVDVYRLVVAPVVVGTGSRLFSAEGPARVFTTTRNEATPSGARVLEMTPQEFRKAEVVIEDGVQGVRAD